MRLKVEGFSCIQYAKLELRPYTVVIGEQGSGKSLLLKLNYFMMNQIISVPEMMLQGTHTEALDLVKDEFIQWFPKKAWGYKDFSISLFINEVCLLSIERNSADDLQIALGPEINEIFIRIRENFDGVMNFVGNDALRQKNISMLKSTSIHLNHELKNLLGQFFVRNQLYVPSGRAFFSSLKKVAAYLNPVTELDDVTRIFGQVYLSCLEDFRKDSWTLTKSQLLETVIGGEFRHENGVDFIYTADGREVDLSILSSGQQEIFPLIVVLDMLFTPTFPRLTVDGKKARLLYLEEPEAHLFPEAQGRVIEDLVARKEMLWDHLFLLLSTHSPYVLSKLNNLVYAGSLAAQSIHHAEKIQALISQDHWINPSDLAAYALKEGVLHSIIDEQTGLIDAEYLDSFSFALDDEFSALMEIERYANQ